MKVLSTFGAVLLTLSVAAQAEVRREDYLLWRRAKTLTSGQQVFSVRTSYQEFNSRFAADGTVEPLGNQYANTITVNQLLKADTVNADAIRDHLSKQGIHGDDVIATSAYQIQRKELGFGFNWSYGLMKNWMIGIDAPLTQTTTRVERHVEMLPQFARTAGADAPPDSVLALKSNQLRARIRALAEQELTANGYDAIPSQKQSWDFGDVNLRSQELIARSYDWQWATQQLVRFPTAQNPSLSDYVQSSQDEGPVNLGLASLFDYQIKKMVAGLRGGYVMQLPDSARMHAQRGGSNVDPKVSRDLGDWLWLATDIEYHFTRKFDVSLEYSYLAKAKDKYSGEAFSREEYDRMAEGTDMSLHQTRLGMAYRIGNVSSRAGVSNKWIAELDYTYPWIGRNASEAARASLEIINYF